MKKVNFKRFTFALMFIFVFVSIFAGCAKKDDSTALQKIQKSLTELKTYSCTAQITQRSNKGEKTYETKQIAKTTGEYRIEMLSPEKIAGTVTIFNGTGTFQYNPRVNGSLKIDLPASQLRNELLLTSFIRNYLNSENVAVFTSTENESMYTVLEAIIPGTNPYMTNEKLFVSNDTLMPVRLVICDDSGGERIVVSYSEIVYNVKLDESLFTIN